MSSRKLKQDASVIRKIPILIELLNTLQVDIWNYIILDIVHQLCKKSEDGWCTTSRGSMGALMGLETVTIQKRVGELVENGFLEKKENGALKLSQKIQSYYDIYKKFDEDIKSLQ